MKTKTRVPIVDIENPKLKEIDDAIYMSINGIRVEIDLEYSRLLAEFTIREMKRNHIAGYVVLARSSKDDESFGRARKFLIAWSKVIPKEHKGNFVCMYLGTKSVKTNIPEDTVKIERKLSKHDAIDEILKYGSSRGLKDWTKWKVDSRILREITGIESKPFSFEVLSYNKRAGALLIKDTRISGTNRYVIILNDKVLWIKEEENVEKFGLYNLKTNTPGNFSKIGKEELVRIISAMRILGKIKVMRKEDFQTNSYFKYL